MVSLGPMQQLSPEQLGEQREGRRERWFYRG
jgi:hypothetical protein